MQPDELRKYKIVWYKIAICWQIHSYKKIKKQQTHKAKAET